MRFQYASGESCNKYDTVNDSFFKETCTENEKIHKIALGKKIVVCITFQNFKINKNIVFYCWKNKVVIGNFCD